MSDRKCMKCGTENPVGAVFCIGCGASLEETVVICPKCGEENSEKAKFCMGCGTKLTGLPGWQSGQSEKSVTDQEAGVDLNGRDPVSPEDETDSGLEKKETATSAGSDERPLMDVASHVDREEGLPIVEASMSKNQKRMEESEQEGREKSGKKKKLKGSKKKIIGIGAAIVIVILILSSMFSSPAIENIEVYYDGETAAGTKLDESNEGIKVIGVDKEGEEHEVSAWTIEEPKTLEVDSSATVTVAYKDLTADLTVDCSTSEMTEITASYSGDASAGVVLDTNNNGFTVTAHYKNGDEEVVDGWTIEEPQTLAADSTANVLIKYGGKETALDVICTTVTIDKITAKYDGSTKAGVEVGEGSKDVTVTAHYRNGEKQEVTGWTVDKPVTLKEGETSKLKIHYGENDCTLKIECTDLSKKQYKSKCKSYTYNEIARDPDDYEGKKAKFSGKVLQALESSDSAQVDMRVAVDGDYDQVLYVVYYMPEGSSRILEDDYINVFGELGGVYTYTSTMNAQITIPIMYAQYVD